MYYIIERSTSRTVFKSEFLDDIEAWFERNDPRTIDHEVEFESLDD